MCGSGPHERDAKGNIDFEKEDRTRIAEVIDFLDPNFKKVIHGNFPIRDHCFGGFLNVTATQCGDSITIYSRFLEEVLLNVDLKRIFLSSMAPKPRRL